MQISLHVVVIIASPAGAPPPPPPPPLPSPSSSSDPEIPGKKCTAHHAPPSACACSNKALAKVLKGHPMLNLCTRTVHALLSNMSCRVTLTSPLCLQQARHPGQWLKLESALHALRCTILCMTHANDTLIKAVDAIACCSTVSAHSPDVFSGLVQNA